MIRMDWRALSLGVLLPLLLSCPAARAEEGTPEVVRERPAEIAPPPEEVAEILQLRELLELMELLEDLDVLTQAEEKQ